MLYRIWTEDKNEHLVRCIVNERFKGYSIYKAKGYWHGKVEDSLVVEIDTTDVPGTEDVDYISISQVAKQIKKTNQQESVLIQKIACESRLI